MISIKDYKLKVEETVSFLKNKITREPSVVITLGTGLGGLVDSIDIDSMPIPIKHCINLAARVFSPEKLAG